MVRCFRGKVPIPMAECPSVPGKIAACYSEMSDLLQVRLLGGFAK